MNPIAMSQHPEGLILEGRDGGVVLGPDRVGHLDAFGLYVVFGAGTVGGTVVLETAPQAEWKGLWHPLGSVTWLRESRAHYLGVRGAFTALRVRVAEPIAGGIVRVYATAH